MSTRISHENVYKCEKQQHKYSQQKQKKMKMKKKNKQQCHNNKIISINTYGKNNDN